MAFVLTSVTIPSAAPSLSGWLTCLWRINWLHYMQLPPVSLGPATLVRVHTPPCECASASHSAVVVGLLPAFTAEPRVPRQVKFNCLSAKLLHQSWSLSEIYHFAHFALVFRMLAVLCPAFRDQRSSPFVVTFKF